MIRRAALTDEDRASWLRLIRTEGVGPVTFYQLLHQYGSAARALEALPDLAVRGGRRAGLKIPRPQEIETEIAATLRAGGRLIAACEAEYPEALAATEDAPPVICLRGHAHLMAKPCFAIVGARNASLAGRRFAEKLAGELGEAGFIIVSGLASGIDTAAHTGALATGTIAAIAGGIDHVYPAENARLHEQIAERGALIAEAPVGTRPTAQHFPRRNRLISGLSRGVLVVEAAMRSGSLITARLAAEQGREVFAVPGSPMDPRCRGTNNLIRQGAILAESARDILDELSQRRENRLEEPGETPDLFAPAPAEPDEAALEKARALLLENLSSMPVSVDELIRACQITAGIARVALLQLELAGRIDRHPGNRLARRFGEDEAETA
jgi:DNA processing protein